MCGGAPHASGDKCPAVGKKCNKCKGDNHFSKMCRTRTEQPKKDTGGKSSKSKIAVIKLASVASHQRVPQIIVSVCDTDSQMALAKVSATPNTGAEISVAGLDILQQIRGHVNNLLPVDVTLVTATNEAMQPIGKMEILLKYGDHSITMELIVCSDLKGMLLSWIICKELGILHPTYPDPLPPAYSIGAVSTPGATDSADQIRLDLIREFHDVFDENGPLRTMAGPPMKILLKEDAIPYAVNGERHIPFAQRAYVRRMLDDLVAQSIIAPVAEPTEWAHPLVVVGKPNGKLRLCVDLTKLNQHVKRPTHPLRSTKDLVAGIPPTSQIFSTFDAIHSYWQIPLEEECQLYTTFMTPWGRFKLLRATMGLVSAGDEYNRRGDDAFREIPNLTKFVDNFCVWNDNFAQHLASVRAFLECCRQNCVTLSESKFEFAKTRVAYGGFIIQPGGVGADPSKVAAIANFPRPNNITQLRSILVLVEQLAQFSPHIRAAATPLRPLLCPSNTFEWSDDCDAAFNNIKSALVSPPILSQFDPSRETMLQTDASRRNDFGYVLLQRHYDCWRMIECGSRFVSDAESRYAVVELELCAVEWAMRKCRLYLIGLPSFTLVVDHQALVTILDKYTLDAVENPKHQALKEKLTPYVFKTVWRKGSLHSVPDALSRAPVSDPTPEDVSNGVDVIHHVRSVIQIRAISTADDEKSKEPALSDPILVSLRTTASEDPD